MAMVKKWIGLGRPRRPSSGGYGEEAGCFHIRAPRNFRSDSLPKIFFRVVPPPTPDPAISPDDRAGIDGEAPAVKFSPDETGDTVNAGNSTSDVSTTRLESDVCPHPLFDPNSSLSAKSTLLDAAAGHESPLSEPSRLTAECGGPRDSGGESPLNASARRSKTAPSEGSFSAASHSRVGPAKRSLTERRCTCAVAPSDASVPRKSGFDGIVPACRSCGGETPYRGASVSASALAPPSPQPCFTAAAAEHSAPAVSAGLHRLMADLYGGSPDDRSGGGGGSWDSRRATPVHRSTTEGNLYTSAISESRGSGGGGSSERTRRVAWERFTGANNDDDSPGKDFLPYPEDACGYSAAFRSGPLPPPRSPARFAGRSPAHRGGGAGGGGHGGGHGGSHSGCSAGSPLSRNATLHHVPRGGRASRRTLSQQLDFPGFQQDFGGSGGGRCGEFETFHSHSPSSAVKEQEGGFASPLGFRAGSGGGSLSRSSPAHPPKGCVAMPVPNLGASPTRMSRETERNGVGKGNVGGEGNGGGIGGEAAERLGRHANGHRGNLSGLCFGIREAGISEADDLSRAPPVRGRANLSASAHSLHNRSPSGVDLFQDYQHNRNPGGWTNPHTVAHSGPLPRQSSPYAEKARAEKQGEGASGKLILPGQCPIGRNADARERSEIPRAASGSRDCGAGTAGARSGKPGPTYAMAGSLRGGLGESPAARHRHRRMHSTSSSSVFSSSFEKGSWPHVTFVSSFERHIQLVAEAERLDQLAMSPA